MKRIVLFLITNIAVMIVLSITLSVLGVDRFMSEQGLNVGMLLIFSAVVGLVGSFFSLLISKPMAKWTAGVQIIEQPRNADEAWIVETVRKFADKAGIGMPEVAIFEGAPNAFATGAFKNDALVAVSTGLLQSMNREEVEAVLGHEVAHIANGDMVTLTLIQGVVNTFVVFLSRIVGFVVDRVLLRNERGTGPGYFLASFVAQILLGIVASMIVMWFSRQREFRADAGGARLAGRESMIRALQSLQLNSQPARLPEAMRAFGIAGGRAGGLRRLFMSHPPIEERIAALQRAGNE